METVPITREGYEALKKEVEKIKKIDRPMNIKAIEEARAHGDLSENAEFEAAKNRQSFIEGRLLEIGHMLATADIIDPDTLPKDRAVFASTVILENIDTGETSKYQLVGPFEADIEKGRISISSPVGKAIIGKKPGEEITLIAPAGRRSYELVDIL